MATYQHQVQYYETDQMGVTNHTNYIRFMEEARSEFLRLIGWPYDQFEKHGIISPVVNVQCKYKQTTTFPDIINIDVKVLDVTKAKLFLSYNMSVNGKTVCTAKSEHCFLNQKKEIVNIKKHLPDFYEQLQKLI